MSTYLDAKIGFDSEENELSQVCLSKQAMTTPQSKIWLCCIKPESSVPRVDTVAAAARLPPWLPLLMQTALDQPLR